LFGLPALSTGGANRLDPCSYPPDRKGDALPLRDLRGDDSGADREEGGGMTELSPGYYAAMPQQPIDVIRANLSPEQLTGFYLGNAIKYLLRFNVNPSAPGASGKGGLTDLKKAATYIEWAIALEESA